MPTPYCNIAVAKMRLSRSNMPKLFTITITIKATVMKLKAKSYTGLPTA